MPWIAGQQLQGGKYVIEKVLGLGGFGITYKALQVELNRLVVIKTPNEHLSHDPEYEKYIARFIKEGKILARLSQDPHPHIVGVIDLFQEGNTHCLVMEFVEGETLFEVVKRRGALPANEIVQCIFQIGEALVNVHQAGLVHRDAHPGNIMLRSNGKAVLIDFGIAKELVPQTVSSTGNAGNKGFAPYEQMTRGSREPTVDVYCLTATLYYALTGQPPTNSLARKLENFPLKPPKQIIPSISHQLNQVILKGMALEAQDRPQSMHLFLEMLEASQEMLEASQETLPLPRIIPWIWLVGLLFIYVFISYLLVVSKAPFWGWVWSIAVAVSVALTGALTVTYPVDVAVSRALFMAVAVSGIMAVAVSGVAESGVVIWVGGGAIVTAWSVALGITEEVVRVCCVSVAGIKAEEKLQKSFSQFHTFMILVVTSALGLGLGVIVHWVSN